MTEFDVYLLDPKTYSPEVIAVAFAKTSRNPETFKEIANDLTDIKSSRFHEKWVVGYGHSSVAEHSVLHIAVEGISRLSCEIVESCRLASYTEKSSRYQIFDKSNYYTPDFSNLKLKLDYDETINQLYNFYLLSIKPIKTIIQENHPRHENESITAYESRIKSKYIDNCRYILPSAALTNVGLTINARSLEYTITKLLSHPLGEANKIGRRLKEVATREVPTLVKYASENNYLRIDNHRNIIDCSTANQSYSRKKAILINSLPEEEIIDSLVSALLYKHSYESIAEIMRYVSTITQEERQKIVLNALDQLNPHDSPIREFEHITFTFECLMDQGAYYDIKRHRMMTQSVQLLSVYQGFTMPSLFEAANLDKQYKTLMDKVCSVYESIKKDHPFEASYVVPNAFRRRVLISVNFRELFVMSRLRIKDSGHFSYRQLTAEIIDEFKKHYPFLGSLLPSIEGRFSPEYISSKHFSKGFD